MSRKLFGILLLAVLSTAIPARGDGFLYQGGTITTIPGANPAGINDAGQIVGNYGNVGFVDTGGVFTTISFPGSTQSDASGINDLGQITGDYCTGPTILACHGFLDSAGVFTAINFPGANSTSVTGINNTGQIVGNYFKNNGWHGFLYSGGGVFTTIDHPGASITYITGINDARQIVGIYGSVGFVDTSGVFTTINGPAGFTSPFPYGINEAGQISGTYCDASGVLGCSAFLDTGGVFTQISVPGAETTNGHGINDAGDVVGYSVPAAPAPEPGTFVLLSTGLISLIGMLLRRR
jgi:hypothetical protein